MDLRIVFDSISSSPSFRTAWGYSVLVGSILFDTGSDGDILLHNLYAMNIPPSAIRAVVISHDHQDHCGGLWKMLSLRQGLPVLVPRGFSKEFYTRVQKAGGQLKLVTAWSHLGNGLYSTGPIQSKYRQAPVTEQSLVIVSDTTVDLVCGCAHPGIVEIAHLVRRQYPDRKFRTVLGGFHLFRRPENEADEVIAQLCDLGFTAIYPMHCSGERLRGSFGRPMGAGNTIRL